MKDFRQNLPRRKYGKMRYSKSSFIPAPNEPIFVYCRLYELVPEPLLSELRS